MNRQTERDMIAGVVKFAELGGVGNDQAFEESLASMATAYIRERAPSLEPYMLGFQVLDRSDDGKKALGVTGFSIGKTTVLAPLFWLNGEIKGHEMMGLPEFQICLPLKENWLNHMLQRKPPMIGDPIDRSDVNRDARRPDLRRLVRSPYKMGCSMPHWAVEGHRFLKTALETPVAPPEGSLLCDAIREIGRPAFDAFRKVAAVSPKLAEAALGFHGDRLLDALEYARTAVPQAVKRAKDETTEKRPKVRVLTYQSELSALIPSDLPEETAAKLIADGIAVDDQRGEDEVTRAYTMDVAKAFNPTSAGLFDVITKDQGIRKCLIIDSPFGTSGRSSKVLLVDMESSSPYAFTESTAADVWCTAQHSEEDYRKTIEDFPELDTLSADDKVALIAPNGLGTVPFHAEDRVGTDSGESIYHFSGYECGPRPTYALRDKDRARDVEREHSHRPMRMVVEAKPSKGAKFRNIDGTLYVSPDVRTIRLTDSYDGRLRLGRLSDLTKLFDMNFAKIAVRHDSGEFRLAVNDGHQSRPLLAKSAMTQLVMHHGLREDAARQLIKTATVHRRAQAFVKYASPYLSQIQTQGPAWPNEPPQGSWEAMGGDAMQVEEPYGISQRVEMPDETVMPADEVHRFGAENQRNVAMQAAEMGMQDVFDASMFISMTRAMRDDQIIDRYIPSLAKAMDATARLLFQLYWHRDDFAERYGDKDVPDIEDGLRNLLEGLGDMTLKLKTKTVDPYPESQDLGVNLSDLASTS